MSTNKIGNYVHLNPENYEEFGINKAGGRKTGPRSYQGWNKLVKAHDKLIVSSKNN
jgi:hypothetical protein